MPPQIPFTPHQLFLLWLGSGVAAFGVAAVLRLWRRLPFFKPRIDNPVLDESWGSAASSTGLLGGKLGWGRNCVWVIVTAESLRIGPHFPFNLFFPPLLFGLELSIPLASVTSVERSRSSWTGQQVHVSYTRTDEARGVLRTEELFLQVKQPDRLVSLLRDRMRPAKT